LQVGEQPNWDWWIRRSWLEKDDAQVSDWDPLFQTLLRVDHPRQGLFLILALVQARRDKDWKDRIALTQVLDSDLPIQDRAPLLLALGRAETGKTIPDTRWLQIGGIGIAKRIPTTYNKRCFTLRLRVCVWIFTLRKPC
jgi:hypothetical protein